MGSVQQTYKPTLHLGHRTVVYQYSEDILRVEDIQQFEAILGFEDILSGRGHSALVSSAPSTGATTVPCHSTFRSHFEFSDRVFRKPEQEW